MNSRSIQALVFLTILWGNLPTPAVQAYSIQNMCAGSDEPSWSGGEPVHILHCSSGGYPGVFHSDPSGGSLAATDRALGDALWMYTREGNTSGYMYGTGLGTTSNCSGPENGAWFDQDERRSGGLSEFWFEETQTTVTSTCEVSDAVACAAQWYKCVGRTLESADMLIGVFAEKPYTVVEQNTWPECLVTERNMTGVMMHELGHNYALGHEDGGLALMANPPYFAMNCHAAQGFTAFPFPDDWNGVMNEHRGYPSSNPPTNLSGTAFWWLGSAPAINRITTFSSGGTKTVPAFFVTLHSYYPDGVTRIYFRVRWVPDGLTPTYNWGSGYFSFPSGTVTGPLRYIDVSAQSKGYSAAGYVNETVHTTSWPVGAKRAWIEVDPYQYHSETDEGDNVFPTDIRVVRE